MNPYTPERLTRWMLISEQPERLPLEHKAQEDIAWAADEIARLSPLESYFLQAQRDYDRVKAENERLREVNTRLLQFVGWVSELGNKKRVSKDIQTLVNIADDLMTEEIARAALASE